MKNVLITGASSGIGEAYAKAFAKEGYRVILVARREKVLEEVAKEIKEKYKGHSVVIPMDLSEENASVRLYEEVTKRNLQVDILINNAGFATKGRLHESDFTKQQNELHVNIIALTELTHLFIRDMAKRKNGTIINVASAAAFNPVPFNAVYSSTKAYVLNFTQSLAYEYRKLGVRLMAVCPQATNTHFFDDFNKMKGKMRQPEDVVRSTMKALRGNKVVVTDGVMCYLQSLMHHFLSRKMIVRITGIVGESIWGTQISH